MYSPLEKPWNYLRIALYRLQFSIFLSILLLSAWFIGKTSIIMLYALICFKTVKPSDFFPAQKQTCWTPEQFEFRCRRRIARALAITGLHCLLPVVHLIHCSLLHGETRWFFHCCELATTAFSRHATQIALLWLLHRIWCVFRQPKSKFTDATAGTHAAVFLHVKLSVKIAYRRASLQPCRAPAVAVNNRVEAAPQCSVVWWIANKRRKHICVMCLWLAWRPTHAHVGCSSANGRCSSSCEVSVRGETWQLSVGRSVGCYDNISAAAAARWGFIASDAVPAAGRAGGRAGGAMASLLRVGNQADVGGVYL